MKHTSINCCTFGVDLTVTDPSTGRVKMIQWTWEEVEAFVSEHGIDVTDKTRNLVGTFWDGAEDDEEESEQAHTVRCSTHGEPWPCSVCAGQQRGG